MATISRDATSKVPEDQKGGRESGFNPPAYPFRLMINRNLQNGGFQTSAEAQRAGQARKVSHPFWRIFLLEGATGRSTEITNG